MTSCGTDTVRSQIEGLVLLNGGELDIPAAQLERLGLIEHHLQSIQDIANNSFEMEKDFNQAMRAMFMGTPIDERMEIQPVGPPIPVTITSAGTTPTASAAEWKALKE